MTGRKGAEPDHPRSSPGGVIRRKSSDFLAVNHKGVANSMRFIWEHFHEPIRVKDLLNVAGMSRRGTHKASMENIGRTPGQELQRLRMKKPKGCSPI